MCSTSRTTSTSSQRSLLRICRNCKWCTNEARADEQCQEKTLDFQRGSHVSACLVTVETLVAESHSAAVLLQVYIARVLGIVLTSKTFGCDVITLCICNEPPSTFRPEGAEINRCVSSGLSPVLAGVIVARPASKDQCYHLASQLFRILEFDSG